VEEQKKMRERLPPYDNRSAAAAFEEKYHKAWDTRRDGLTLAQTSIEPVRDEDGSFDTLAKRLSEIKVNTHTLWHLALDSMSSKRE
jgi:hypothetical protein